MYFDGSAFLPVAAGMGALQGTPDRAALAAFLR
jgi:hypothetical protein